MVDATPLIFPQLGPVYQALFPWAEALLRAVVGLTLVPHGLRSAFGMFPSTGAQSHNLTEFANELDRDGYHPGKWTLSPCGAYDRPAGKIGWQASICARSIRES